MAYGCLLTPVSNTPLLYCMVLLLLHVAARWGHVGGVGGKAVVGTRSSYFFSPRLSCWDRGGSMSVVGGNPTRPFAPLLLPLPGWSRIRTVLVRTRKASP